MVTFGSAVCAAARVFFFSASLFSGGVVLAGQVSHGPMIGAPTPDSVQIWARWDAAGTAEAHIQSVGIGTKIDSPRIQVLATNDYTTKFKFDGLIPDSRYRYWLKFFSPEGVETASLTYYFRTPKVDPDMVSVVVMGDFMTQQRASAALVAATTPRPDALMIIGDLDHTGPTNQPGSKEYYPPEQAPMVLANMRTMRREARNPARPLGTQFQRAFVSSQGNDKYQLPLYNVWDDHDYCQNGAEIDCPFANEARQVYSEYFLPAADNGLIPTPGCATPGIWQLVRFGTLAEFYMLDSRSNRNTALGTMLGDCQRQWLFDRLASSTAAWKFILSPVTFNPLTKPWDAWGGAFGGEREAIVSFIQSNRIANVAVLSADIHSGGAIDDGRHSGLPEVSVPHANMPTDWVNTYCHLDDNDSKVLVSAPGSWTIGSLKDPNIGGAPQQCLGRDLSGKLPAPLPPGPYPLDGKLGAGYVLVKLTRTGATLSVMDSTGVPRTGFRSDGSPAGLKLEFSR